MSRPRRGLRSAALAAAVALAVTGGAQAERSREMSPEETRGLAIAAAETGRSAEALRLAEALVARDPADAVAWLVRARALRDTGRLIAARAAAREAWRIAETPTERHAAARIRAQVLASSGNRTVAQFWLRRAAQAAPDARARAATGRDYAYLRRRNRLGIDAGFSIAPVSNINNGSHRETGTFDLPVFGTLEMQLAGTARALSGTEAAASLALRWRFDESGQDVGRTALHLAIDRRDYVLSDEARRIAPDAEGSDYAQTVLRATLARHGVLAGPNTPFVLTAATGRSRYGGEPHTRYVDLGYTQRTVLPDARTALTVQAGVRRRDALSPRTSDADTWRGRIGWTRGFAAGRSLSAGLEAVGSVSDAASLDYRGEALFARADFGRVFGDVAVDLALTAGERRYDRGPVAGLGRLDRHWEAALSATLHGVERYGFVPVVTVTAGRTDSDFGQYDAEKLGLRLGIRSAF